MRESGSFRVNSHRHDAAMKLRHPLLQKTAGLVAAAVGGCLRRTIDWRAVYADPTTDPVHARHRGRYIYLGWHEYMLLPIILRGSRRMLALASGHSDGEIIGRAMRHLGWSVVRGSTSRGGAVRCYDSSGTTGATST